MNLKKSKLLIFIIVILIISFISYKTFSVINDPFNITEKTIVEVKSGDTFYSVLDSLDEKGIIKGKSIVKLYTKLTGSTVDLHEGSYEIYPNNSVEEFIKILNESPTLGTMVVTIPEGYTVEKIAKVLEKSNMFTYDEFISAVKNYKVPEYVKVDSNKRYNLEGFLFPDTYHFNENTTPDEVIKIMLDNFENVMKSIEDELKLTIKKEDYDTIVTISSLIQNEARLESEAPIISSVIRNRLKDGMKLQIDATVIYALGYHVDTVLNSHLEIDSLYNTYKYSGLPVGAISNPGKVAIKAAIEPANTDYLYYLLKDVTGENPEHYFTNSDEDFMNKRQEFGYNDI